MGNWVEIDKYEPINLDLIFSFYRENQSIKSDIIVERYFIIFEDNHGDIIRKWNFWEDKEERDSIYFKLRNVVYINRLEEK